VKVDVLAVSVTVDDDDDDGQRRFGERRLAGQHLFTLLEKRDQLANVE
jgi:hypothetical protein